MPYEFTYVATSPEFSSDVLIGLLLSSIISIFALWGLWRMFSKAGRPGWAAIVPFYNLYVLFQLSGRSGWTFLWMFIPFINIYWYVVLNLDIARNFGKSTGFGVLSIFFNAICYMIIGFGSAEYVGFKPDATPKKTSDAPEMPKGA